MKFNSLALACLWCSMALCAMDDSQFDTEYQELFESKFASAMVQQPQSGTAAHAVSQSTVYILQQYGKEVVAYLSEQPKEFEELKRTVYKESILGHLEGPKNTVEDVLGDIEKACSDENSTIETVMPLHAAFGYRVVKKLKARNILGEVCADQYAKAYSQSRKAMTEIQFPDGVRKMLPDGELKLSQLSGTIAEGSRFAEHTERPHFRGRDKFVIDTSDPKVKKVIAKVFENKDIPIAAGPSAHACAEFSSAYTLGLSPREMKELAFLIACYKNHAGHHSFHEVMRAAAVPPFNVPYKVNEYTAYMPEGFKKADAYTKLKEQFKGTIWLNDCKL